MRFVCVLLVVLGMPLTANAQRQHRADRPPTGPGALGLGLSPIGLPVQIPYQKPWEWRVPTPSWERPQVPAWERQGPPPWERGRVAQPVYPVQQHRRRRLPPVVYVPYPVYQVQPNTVAPPPQVVVVTAPPVAPPPEPEVEPEPPPEPAPPIMLPTGSRTIYLIPGCYLGNVMPEADRLPKTCDIRRLKTYEP